MLLACSTRGSDPRQGPTSAKHLILTLIEVWRLVLLLVLGVIQAVLRLVLGRVVLDRR